MVPIHVRISVFHMIYLNCFLLFHCIIQNRLNFFPKFVPCSPAVPYSPVLRNLNVNCNKASLPTSNVESLKEYWRHGTDLRAVPGIRKKTSPQGCQHKQETVWQQFLIAISSTSEIYDCDICDNNVCDTRCISHAGIDMIRSTGPKIRSNN